MAKIYLDTSAINWLADDPGAGILVEAIKDSEFFAHTSALNILELAATTEPSRRRRLLEVARDITRNFYPLEWPNEILKRSLRAHLDGKDQFDASVDQKSSVWAVLQDPDLVNNEAARLFAINEKQSHEKWFEPLHQRARELLQDKEKPQVSKPIHFIAPAAKDQVFLDSFFKNILIAAGADPVKGRAQDVLETVGPWRGYFTALALDHHNRAIRAEKFGTQWNPGGIDIQQAVYLAGTDIFISADKLQRRFLRNVSRIATIKVPVLDYDTFKDLLRS